MVDQFCSRFLRPAKVPPRLVYRHKSATCDAFGQSLQVPSPMIKWATGGGVSVEFLVLPGDCRRRWRTKGNRVMIHTIDQIEEEVLSYEVSDEALEAAAGTTDKVGSFTLSFCTGLDTCPA
jgi:hypothetical protein